MSARLTAVWVRFPLAIRKFITDFVETAAGLVVALNFAEILGGPGFTIEEAHALATVVAGALFAAFVSAARRHTPTLVAWLRTTFPAVALTFLLRLLR